MRIHPRFLALFTVLVLAAACDDSPSEPGDEPLSFQTIVLASSSGFSSPGQQVIRDGDDLAQVWDTLWAGHSPLPPLPAIDFDRQMAVLAAMGTGHNGCHRVEVTRAMRKAEGSLEVEVSEFEPGPACNCTQQITQPAHVVKLDRVDGPERFVVRRRQLAC